MSEKKPGFLERSSDKIRKAAGLLGLVAVAGYVLAPLPGLANLAVDGGVVWFGADQIKSSSQRRRLNARH